MTKDPYSYYYSRTFVYKHPLLSYVVLEIKTLEFGNFINMMALAAPCFLSALSNVSMMCYDVSLSTDIRLWGLVFGSLTDIWELLLIHYKLRY